MAEARGNIPAQRVRAGRYTAAGSILYEGGATGALRVRNLEASGVGNDHAFDNLSVIDVSPQIQKTFASPVLAGQPIRLTFTIANTPDQLQKRGWSVSDNLASGLRVADLPNVATTCTGTTIDADAGSSVITLSDGNLPAGPSCTITLDVVATLPGTYSNGPANMAPSVAINLPGSPVSTEVVTNRITVRKVSREGVGAFAITGNHGMQPQTLTTTIAGTVASGSQQILAGTSGVTDTVIREALTAGWRLANASCTGLAADTSVAFTAEGSLTIPFAGLSPQSGGRDVVCTLENMLDTDLSISKQNADPNGGAVLHGATTHYTLRVTNHGPGTSTHPVVRDVASAGLSCATTSPVTCAGPAGACATGSATFGDLTGAGLTLGVFAVGASVDLGYDCQVQ